MSQLIAQAEKKLPDVMMHFRKFVGAQNDYYKKAQKQIDDLYKSL